MRNLLYYTVLIGLLFSLQAWSPGSVPAVEEAAVRTLPNVNIKRLNGETVNIQEYARNGKVTVLAFWATWCGPCKRELDAYLELYPEWRDDLNTEVVAVTIDNARALSKVRPMVERNGWPFEILSDVNEDLKQALNFPAIPQTFVIDLQGEIVYEHSGYQPGDEYKLEALLKKLSGK